MQVATIHYIVTGGKEGLKIVVRFFERYMTYTKRIQRSLIGWSRSSI